jgi:threonine/homoserine/homoserine lactone efflux protein
MGMLIPGLVLGFSVAVPIGPMALLCIRRILVNGPRAGLATGAGIATADGAYALVAAFGLTAIAALLVEQRVPLAVTGGIVLGYLGVKIALSPVPERPAEASGRGLACAYLSALALTLANPMTILSFAAAFAGLGLAVSGGYRAGSFFVLGVFLGSAIWWLVLTASVSLARRRLGRSVIVWLNRAAGSLIVLFGLLILLRVFL